ncbi:MAG: Rrf2 family transcriptional regulator [Phycisphaeraceae bacterium]
MIRYGKLTQNAIAAMSRLAEVYPQGVRLSSGDIAEARQIPKTLAAKLLTRLSQAGLVGGAPGPGGGYSLAKPPGEISLLDIVAVFERTEDRLMCPFGPNWCGNGSPCPMHEKLAGMAEDFETFLRDTTLDVFCRDTPCQH